ncbi:cell division protein FtsQ [Abditibacteriota bacterium]|nr:cell division protein FtsQ [Abditibacteriota bacterium]
MSSSSQSGPSPQPNSSQSRRLQTPEERFGSHPLYAVDPEPEAAPDPFVPLPDPARTITTTSTRPIKSRRAKARHERQRFEREAHHVPPRRATHSRTKIEDKKGHADSATTSSADHDSPQEVFSPTLERIRDGRKRFWKRLSAVTALLLMAGAGAAALFAPQMKIEKVQITGLHATSSILVKPIAQRLLGHNVFLAPKAAIAQSVERLPTVASARVVLSADMPPRVELRVVERKPIMRLGYNNLWWVADESGNPYRHANARDAHLPALTWNGPIQTLKPVDAKRWDDAVQLAQAVQGQSINKSEAGLGQIHSMQLDASGDATLMLASPDGVGDLTLKLGNDQWSEKLERARVAMMYFARTKRQAAELNLIALDYPRWTPRGAITSEATPAPTENQVPAT